MKRFFAFFIVLVLLFNFSIVFAENSKITVMLDQKEISFDQPPVIDSGRTLVPLRAIFEAFGASVLWNEPTKTVTASKGDIKIILQIGNTKASVNEYPVELDVPAKILNGRTLVPVRFISESLGTNVNWDGSTRTVKIRSLYDVVEVTDGDTFVINLNGVKEKIRLIGVNTPETVHPTKGAEPYGKEASDFTKSCLSGKKVSIELDIQERDTYGRILAYAYLDGNMFNKTLLEEGYAQVTTVQPNSKYADVFLKIELVARDNNKGLWSLEYYKNSKSLNKININTASFEDLKKIIHIDEERANQIIQLRPFNSVDDLIKIKGIGDARLKDIIAEGIAAVN